MLKQLNSNKKEAEENQQQSQLALKFLLNALNLCWRQPFLASYLGFAPQ